MINKSYENLVVEKPWGSEYVIYKNDVLAITHLDILYNNSTSLHCHPNKKTGFILLSGTAEIQLGFYNRETLSAPSKTIIRPGLFHSTKAMSENGVRVLEFETPIDKDDLVRFKDNYGREKQSYQGSYKIKKLDDSCLLFKDPDIGNPLVYNVGGVEIKLEKNYTLEGLKEQSLDTIIAVIEGGIRCKKTKKIVLGPGEVIKTGTLIKLAEVFEPDDYIKTLCVKRIN